MGEVQPKCAVGVCHGWMAVLLADTRPVRTLGAALGLSGAKFFGLSGVQPVS
eukprot:NODE_15100_length_225_cov_9.840909_g14187_i0.p3 GENE.NODE_15100_length_225_cov_9.840909_g14187_i0~~NODE_15100_length_225_cov_9.840909_g14187_i0.p3  ORF type:complete len:52 (+),score=5.40 NODE_15100_length_225_cov_9.840909_g14187_i0:45-200(+)